MPKQWQYIVALRKESVDRNRTRWELGKSNGMSLSARRAWIEIYRENWYRVPCEVALRKESVDRNYSHAGKLFDLLNVALRKESVDRNIKREMSLIRPYVALRKESVDRNFLAALCHAAGNGRSPQGERG